VSGEECSSYVAIASPFAPPLKHGPCPQIHRRCYRRGMNYRHGYHAGGFTDVLKHTALCELLRLLTAKDKKLFVLDTHAGAGGYDLSGALAQRTREADGGIVQLMAALRAGMPAAVARYLAAVSAYNGKFGPAGGKPGRYPG